MDGPEGISYSYLFVSWLLSELCDCQMGELLSVCPLLITSFYKIWTAVHHRENLLQRVDCYETDIDREAGNLPDDR